MYRFGQRARLAAVAASIGLAASVVLACAGPVGAATQSGSPSDSRAVFATGNVTRCSDVGFGSDIQVGTTGSATGPRGTATVQTNTGLVHSDQGEELDLTANAGIVVDAVVVKGGAAYNLYTDAAVLPQTLPAPQHYISPFTTGSTVPDISHWFVCYHLEAPPPSGSFSVHKVVIPPAHGIPVTPLPAAYSASVSCDDGVAAHQNVSVNFDGSGGEALTAPAPAVTGLAAGTTCTVVENDPTAAGGVATYEPANAVTVPTTDAATDATIINDFTGVPVQPASVEVGEQVVAPPGVDIPPVAGNVSCDDGTDKDVTLPGTPGAPPVLTVDEGATCTVSEVTPLPPEWKVTYEVGTAPPSTTAPTFVAQQTTQVTINLVNTQANGTNSERALARTGVPAQSLVGIGVALLLVGVAALGTRPRHRSR